MALYSPTQNWEQSKKGKTMSRTVCSWCKAPLVLKDDILVCGNTDCPACDEKYLHEELIRTRKALELAITGLKNCKTRDHIGAVCRTPEYVDKVLEQITALEQKD